VLDVHGRASSTATHTTCRRRGAPSCPLPVWYCDGEQQALLHHPPPLYWHAYRNHWNAHESNGTSSTVGWSTTATAASLLENLPRQGATGGRQDNSMTSVPSKSRIERFAQAIAGCDLALCRVVSDAGAEAPRITQRARSA
jgi:hypothetical protein